MGIAMRIDLAGRTALVTGSTEGIGYAIAAGLAAAGARVVINGRAPERIDAAIARIKAAVPEAAVDGAAADVGTAAGCDALVQAVPAPDILVNNVGIYEPKPFAAVPDADWERFFQVNVMSGVRLSRAYLDGMIERNWGRILFISSESAINIPPEMLPYAVTKTAMLALSRGLAKLAKGSSVTVNALLPGPTLTEGVEGMLKDEAERSGKTIAQAGTEFVQTYRSSSLLQRLAEPEEVASLAVFLCSPQASATTGAALRVDGGVIETIV
jgi:NAD(P)-dependent dehydrogenase (short-subunit alcohol dehydrogenase family)